jgi:hypothetical protein
MADCACASETPGARRAIPSIQRAARSSSMYVPLNAGCVDAGTQNCIAYPTKVPANSGGATPMIVNGMPLKDSL